MDFSNFKPGQLRCVKTLDAPVVVSAGAGSGKTFTLTQRIAWALLPGSGCDGGSFLDDIGQVLAITFTEKAAGEIKSRVKKTLAAEGLVEQALKVDDAWISTIHGMCSRILRMHAPELGIDPAFSIVDAATAGNLLDSSINEALLRAYEYCDKGELDALFAEYSARITKSSFGGSSVERMVREIVLQAVKSPRGICAIEVTAVQRSQGEVMRALIELASQASELVGQQKQSSTRDAYLDKNEEFLNLAEEFVFNGAPGAELFDVLNACPMPPASIGTKDCKEAAKEYQAQIGLLVQEAKLCFAAPYLDTLLKISTRVCELYAQRKRDLGLLDNDDLLVFTAKAFDENERIRSAYAGKFKIVMVDEFQDTNQLQVDIISALAGDAGERLCTVGDAQQSIYRFNGADVAVYNRHLQRVRANDASMPIELPDNFRSHRDVLAFVDRVFERPAAFGDSFMSLTPSRDEAKVNVPYLAGPSRVRVLATAHPSKGGAEDPIEVEAHRLAAVFAEMRAAGHRPGDMVVLLSVMTNANVYAQALREARFDCVIAGGSIFSKAAETQTMVLLARVIANPKSTAAVFGLLASDMFNVSADDLLVLTTYEKNGAIKKRGLSTGLSQMGRAAAKGAKLPASLATAVRVVSRFPEQVGNMRLSQIMREAVLDSGWLARLEGQGPEGLSCAGNIYKAIRLVEGFEADGALGIASAAEKLVAHVQAEKEAPGALSAEGGDFVRIMTAHSSKGLEFPIVAVAEMSKKSKSGGNFQLHTIDGVSYVSLEPSKSIAKFEDSSTVNKGAKYSALDGFEAEVDPDFVRAAGTPLLRRDAAKRYAEEQDAAERQRLMYVALTRAKEALVVCLRDSSTSKRAAFSDGVYGDVRAALFGEEGDIPAGESAVDFGGSAPALVSRYDVAKSEPDMGQAQEDGPSTPKTLTMYVPEEPLRLDETPWRAARDGVTSYSALAAGATQEKKRAPKDDESFWEELGRKLYDDADKATDVGTAFHSLAEFCARKASNEHARVIFMPSEQRIAATTRHMGVSAGARARVTEALERWCASDVAAVMASHENLHAELPFFVSFPESEAADAANAYLEGSIDLFASDEPARGTAFIVDYKTGGNPREAPDQLREKHRMQAMCYAYATMLHGFDEVQATFVRVEVPEADGSPQTVGYRFTKDDMPTLLRAVQGAWRTLKENA